MSTELFLIIITLCTVFVNKEDQLPALVYLLISFFLFFLCKDITESYVYLISMLTEAFLVVCLTCFKQSYKSKLVSRLLPVSYAAVFLDLFGFLMAWKGYLPDMYNELVVVYCAIIVMLFLSVGKWWNGSFAWLSGIFRHTDNNNNHI